MNCGHEGFFNSKLLVENFCHRGQTIGCAGGVGDNVMFFWIVCFFIDPQDKSDIRLCGRGRDNNLLSAALFDMLYCILSFPEQARGFNDGGNPQIFPRKIARIFLRKNFNCFIINYYCIF